MACISKCGLVSLFQHSELSFFLPVGMWYLRGGGDHPEIFGSQGLVLTSSGNSDTLKIGWISPTHNTGHDSLNSCIADTTYF